MATRPIDIVKRYHDSAWADPQSGTLSEASREMLADDFQSLDEDGNVQMDKATYIAMSELMLGSFDDLTYVRTDLTESGDDSALMTGHFEGTHTGDFDLSAMGLGVIPASGKKIVWPDATIKWIVKDDKIVGNENAGGSAGLEGFLAPLGVKPASG
jgi:hypothetical protein